MAASATSSRRTACCSSSPVDLERATRSRTCTSITSGRSVSRTGTSSTWAWSFHPFATAVERSTSQAVGSVRRQLRGGRVAIARAGRHAASAIRRRQARERQHDVVSAPVRRDRCGRDQPLVRSRGQALDHVAFTVERLDDLVARLRLATRQVIEGPYAFGDSRAVMSKTRRPAIEPSTPTGATPRPELSPCARD